MASPSRIRFSELTQTLRKAGPGPIMPNAGPPQPTPQQIQHQQQLDAQRREAARARSKVPTDKDIPDGVEGIIIGDAVERYRNLRQAEKNLDAVMMRKRLENQDALPRTHQLQKTMRIWISNTTENQPWQQMTMDNEAFDFGDSSQATYKVKIEGRLLDDDGDELDTDDKEDGDVVSPENGQDGEDADKKQKGSKPVGAQRTRLSHFFKQITLEFDRNSSLQPDQLAQVEWKKPEARDQRGTKQLNLAEDENFDCIEFERKGDENLNVTVNLIRDDYPERYRLSPPLADLLDMVESDRGGVITGLWHYIRHNKLYEDEETRQIRCDAKLRSVCVPPFKRDPIRTNIKAPTDLQRRPHLLLSPTGPPGPTPNPSPCDQTPLHDPRRRGAPNRPQTYNLRHLGARRGPTTRACLPRPDRDDPVVTNREVGRADRAVGAGDAGFEGEARFLRGHVQGSRRVYQAMGFESAAGFGGHFG